MKRRSFLGGLTVVSLPAAAIAAHEPKLSLPEKAQLHAKALADVMAEMNPDRSWRHIIDDTHKFALIIGDPKPV